MKRHQIVDESEKKSQMKHLQKNLKQLQKQMEALLKVKKPKQSDIKRLCLPSVSSPKISKYTQNISALRAQMKSLDYLDKASTSKIKQLKSEKHFVENEQKLNNENTFSKFTKYSNQVKLRNSIKRIRNQLIKNRKETLLNSNWKQNKSNDDPVSIKVRSKSSNQYYKSIEEVHLDESKKRTKYETEVNKVFDLMSKSANKQQEKIVTLDEYKKTKKMRIKSQMRNRQNSFCQKESNVLSGIENGLMNSKKQIQHKVKIRPRIISEEQKINKFDRDFQSIRNSPRSKFLQLSRYVLIFNKSSNKDKKYEETKSDLKPKYKISNQVCLKKSKRLPTKEVRRQDIQTLEMPCSPWDLLDDSFQDPFS